MKFGAAGHEKIKTTAGVELKMGEEKQVDAVLYAEFDIDKGSTLRESYPRAFPDYSPEFFADVMLPEGVHNRQQDFTIFFLNRDKRHGVATAAATATTAEGEPAVTEETRQQEEKDPLKEFMYCFSVVRTHHDATVRRGARVKAVALCSRHKFSFAFKSVLEVAVSKLAVAKDEVETKHILEELYTVVNAVESGGARNISDVERRLLKSQIDVTGSKSLVEQKAQEESLYYHTTAQWGEQKIPLKFKVCSTEDQFDEGLLRRLLLKFGEQSMVLYNAVLTGQRVLVLGYNQPAGDVCNYVLAMSSLVCPPLSGLIQRQYPYANLTDLSFLSTPGFIAGVTNPMFKSKRDWWDVLCDVSNGDVLLSAQAERDEFEAADRTFVQEVLDGIHAGYSEEWVRCQFEEYTLQNVVDLAVGEANYMDVEAMARKTAMNNRRITKWARTDNYKSFVDTRQLVKSHTDAFNAGKTGIDLKKHIRWLQGDMVIPDDSHVESIYADLASLLHTEQELQEFLSYLPSTRGGLQAVAQGIYHTSMSVKYNTVLLLQRLESFPSTASSLQQLNAFVLMTYQRIHNIVQPDVRQ